jgi:hypothetical protein
MYKEQENLWLKLNEEYKKVDNEFTSIEISYDELEFDNEKYEKKYKLALKALTILNKMRKLSK